MKIKIVRSDKDGTQVEEHEVIVSDISNNSGDITISGRIDAGVGKSVQVEVELSDSSYLDGDENNIDEVEALVKEM